jgi:signal peptidase II
MTDNSPGKNMRRHLNSGWPQFNPATINFRRLFIVLFTLFFIIYSDQYTKSIAQKYLSGLSPVSFYSETVIFSYVENSGGFLGMVSKYPWYFQFFLLNICVPVILLYCLYYLLFKKNLPALPITTLSIITGGGISNLIDRIINNGAVIDFIQIRIGLFKTGIFNLADIYIIGGSFLLGFLFLKSKPGE